MYYDFCIIILEIKGFLSVGSFKYMLFGEPFHFCLSFLLVFHSIMKLFFDFSFFQSFYLSLHILSLFPSWYPYLFYSYSSLTLVDVKLYVVTATPAASMPNA